MQLYLEVEVCAQRAPDSGGIIRFQAWLYEGDLDRETHSFSSTTCISVSDSCPCRSAAALDKVALRLTIVVITEQGGTGKIVAGQYAYGLVAGLQQRVAGEPEEIQIAGL